MESLVYTFYENKTELQIQPSPNGVRIWVGKPPTNCMFQTFLSYDDLERLIRYLEQV